jgi:putative ABC transport system permease protein
VLGASGEAGSLPAVDVTTNYFETLGVRPILGRSFLESDGRRGALPVVVIDYTVWQSRFGGSADVIDRQTMINGRDGRIVGVMPNGFRYPGSVRVWVPLAEDEIRAVAAHAESD